MAAPDWNSKPHATVRTSTGSVLYLRDGELPSASVIDAGVSIADRIASVEDALSAAKVSLANTVDEKVQTIADGVSQNLVPLLTASLEAIPTLIPMMKFSHNPLPLPNPEAPVGLAEFPLTGHELQTFDAIYPNARWAVRDGQDPPRHGEGPCFLRIDELAAYGKMGWWVNQPPEIDVGTEPSERWRWMPNAIVVNLNPEKTYRIGVSLRVEAWRAAMATDGEGSVQLVDTHLTIPDALTTAMSGIAIGFLDRLSVLPGSNVSVDRTDTTPATWPGNIASFGNGPLSSVGPLPAPGGGSLCDGPPGSTLLNVIGESGVPFSALRFSRMMCSLPATALITQSLQTGWASAERQYLSQPFTGFSQWEVMLLCSIVGTLSATPVGVKPMFSLTVFESPS